MCTKDVDGLVGGVARRAASNRCRFQSVAQVTTRRINPNALLVPGPIASASVAQVTTRGIKPTTVIVAAASTLVNESCPPANGAVDPGERVSVNLELINTDTTSTTNLVGTLQASGNVIAPSGPQSYGAIAPGGMASRTFSFTANGTCGETITLSLQLQDGMTNLGTVAYSITLGCNSSCQIARLVTTNVALSCVGGSVQTDITLQNQGIVSATGVTLTQAQLGSPAVIGAPVPQGPFTLAPGATQNFTVTFATACPFSGTKLLRIKGTSTDAGSWGSTSGVTSP